MVGLRPDHVRAKFPPRPCAKGSYFRANKVGRVGDALDRMVPAFSSKSLSGARKPHIRSGESPQPSLYFDLKPAHPKHIKVSRNVGLEA
jgi:hypothetical protein